MLFSEPCNPKKGTHAPSQSSRPIPLAITRYNQNQSINFLQSCSTRNLHFFTISFFSFITITYLKIRKGTSSSPFFFSKKTHPQRTTGENSFITFSLPLRNWEKTPSIHVNTKSPTLPFSTYTHNFQASKEHTRWEHRKKKDREGKPAKVRKESMRGQNHCTKMGGKRERR